LAEAETVVTANTVETVPGIGILAGSAERRRNLVVTDNVMASVTTGIAVNVAGGAEAGSVRVAGNVIGAPSRGIVGLEGERIVAPDLSADAVRYPGLDITGNSVAQ
jgi:hypothetical protein